MELYYQPHISRKREASFVAHLCKHLPITNINTTYYPLPETLAMNTLSIRQIEKAVAVCSLPHTKKQKLIAALVVLPDIIKVTTAMNQMTCDIVIVDNNIPFFFEFHEEQHRTLKSERPKHIFSMECEKIIVPRYVQRFLRDIWRSLYLRPFTVIWADWFESHNHIPPVLQQGYWEYGKIGKFSFREIVDILPEEPNGS